MDSAIGQPPSDHPPARLLGDAWVQIGLLVWALCIIPSLAPGLSPDLTYTWADQYSDAPMLVMVLLAAAFQVRGAPRQRERVFWRLVVGALIGWLSVRGLYVLVPFELWGTGLDLASDLFYIGGYLCIALALERRPDRTAARGPQARVERVESVGTLVFAFGLLTYFVLIPSVFNPEVYASWVSSLLLYAVLDLYLLIRIIILIRSGAGPGWRGAFVWLAVTFAAWFLGDLAEGLLYLEALPWIDPGTPADILWHIPGLALLLAVRSRTLAGHGPQEAGIAEPFASRFPHGGSGLT